MTFLVGKKYRLELHYNICHTYIYKPMIVNHGPEQINEIYVLLEKFFNKQEVSNFYTAQQ